MGNNPRSVARLGQASVNIQILNVKGPAEFPKNTVLRRRHSTNRGRGLKILRVSPDGFFVPRVGIDHDQRDSAQLLQFLPNLQSAQLATEGSVMRPRRT